MHTIFALNSDPTEIIEALLRPVARFCLRHSIGAQTLLQAMKEVLVQEAGDFVDQSNVSRISVATGLDRREVSRLLEGEPPRKPQLGLLPRVIGAWSTDKRWRNARGEPRILSCEGTSSEFFRLVQEISSDINPYTVLAELEHRKLVLRTSNGLALRAPFFNPKTDAEEALAVLAEDSEDLLFAVTENICRSVPEPNLHLKTEYTRIRLSAVPRIRHWFLKEGTLFHRKAREFLSTYDLDVHPQPDRDAESARIQECRVALATFSRIENTGDNV